MIKTYKSPNYNERPKEQKIDMLVLHSMTVNKSKQALNILTQKKTKVSSHYYIDEKGNMYQLVLEDKRAWHAGVAYWRGHSNINDRSIGIELLNKAGNGYTKQQRQTLIILCKKLIKKYKIPQRNIVAHSDIAYNRDEPKTDPGEQFDWAELAQNKVGLYPATQTSCDLIGRKKKPSVWHLCIKKLKDILLKKQNIQTIKKDLAFIGYITQTPKELKGAYSAFCRHYDPKNLKYATTHTKVRHSTVQRLKRLVDLIKHAKA